MFCIYDQHTKIPCISTYKEPIVLTMLVSHKAVSCTPASWFEQARWKSESQSFVASSQKKHPISFANFDFTRRKSLRPSHTQGRRVTPCIMHDYQVVGITVTILQGWPTTVPSIFSFVQSCLIYVVKFNKFFIYCIWILSHSEKGSPQVIE